MDLTSSFRSQVSQFIAVDRRRQGRSRSLFGRNPQREEKRRESAWWSMDFRINSSGPFNSPGKQSRQTCGDGTDRWGPLFRLVGPRSWESHVSKSSLQFFFFSTATRVARADFPPPPPKHKTRPRLIPPPHRRRRRRGRGRIKQPAAAGAVSVRLYSTNFLCFSRSSPVPPFACAARR